MDRQRGLDLLREAASRILFTDPETITEESRFREDLHADSLDLVEIVSAMEDRVAVVLSGRELKQVKTVGDLLDLMMAERTRVPVSEV